MQRKKLSTTTSTGTNNELDARSQAQSSPPRPQTSSNPLRKPRWKRTSCQCWNQTGTHHKSRKDSIWGHQAGKSESPSWSEKIITPGVEGERTHYISVLTENGKQTETVLDSQVTKEPVTQVVEIGAPITHKGDKHGLAPAAEAKPRLDIQEEEIPFTTVTRENPLLLKGKTQVLPKVLTVVAVITTL